MKTDDIMLYGREETKEKPLRKERDPMPCGSKKGKKGKGPKK